MLDKRTKLAIGYLLFTLCWVLWLLLPVVAFLDLTGPQKALLSGGLIIVAEGAFWLSLIFLGKEFWEKIKTWFKAKKASPD